MIVADTDVLIDFLLGSNPVAGRVAREMVCGRLRTTTVTRYELLVGAQDRSEESRITSVLSALEAWPLDAEAADRAASVRRALDSEGRPIGMADSLIAGIVLTRGASLLTRNRRHFERVPGLIIEQL